MSVKFTYILIASLFLTTSIFAQNYKIVLDEDYSDWDNISGVVDSTANSASLDFQILKVTNFNNFLFLFLEMNQELNLQSSNSIILYIDTDNNSSTGFAINGIGAEIVYELGERTGKFYHDNTSSYIKHYNIGLVTIPTVTSNKFEIELKTDTFVDGKKVFPNSSIKIIVKNNITNGDIIPSTSGGYEFTFLEDEAQQTRNYSIAKVNSEDLRIVSYNVEKDRLFDAENKEAHRRIFNAINPDIIGFEEIYNHSAQETANLISEFLPLSDGAKWYSAGSGSDIIVVSRFPVKNSYSLDGNKAFLLDLTSINQKDFLFVVAHPPCCSNDDARQKEIDHFMSFIRDAKDGTGSLTLESETPIVIVGDMNLVGYNQQQKTLVNGDIVNTALYGNPFTPDWDSTSFFDTKPITSNMPSTFTWYDEGSSFSPGRLDYIVYSNSVINAENSFVLFTPALPQDSLSLYNLNSDDVTSVSDHLPVIADFSFSPKVSVNDSEENNNLRFQLMQNYPNPFNPSTKIKYSIGENYGLKTFVTLKVYDILGREVATLVNKYQSPGNYEVTFDASSFNRTTSSGLYLYKLQSGEFSKTRKMLLVK